MRAAERLLPALAALLLALPASAEEACALATLDLRDPDGTLRFQVEVVDNEAERSRGLMFRENLPRFGAMLFVYETPQPVAFWMRNTLIPLDMLFFDGAGRLARIHRDAVPGDETPIPGGDDIRYVLEINGGVAEQLDIDLGAEIRHPALDQAAAAWPC
jgi:uncharacterized membrane protein (UPF0127 family)